MEKRILRNLEADGVDRRGFLECMAWVGTGLLWTISGGVGYSQIAHRATGATRGTLNFVQISDSHMGFNKAANKDVAATLQEAVAKINALPVPPQFVIHTGDISHLSKASEFDTVDQILKSIKATSQIYFIPGEHDGLGDNGKLYLERYGKGTTGLGWYSFDQNGVHFAGLVDVFRPQTGRPRPIRRGATALARKGSGRTLRQHSDCPLCPLPALGGLSAVGLTSNHRMSGCQGVKGIAELMGIYIVLAAGTKLISCRESCASSGRSLRQYGGSSASG